MKTCIDLRLKDCTAGFLRSLLHDDCYSDSCDVIYGTIDDYFNERVVLQYNSLEESYKWYQADSAVISTLVRIAKGDLNVMGLVLKSKVREVL